MTHPYHKHGNHRRGTAVGPPLPCRCLLSFILTRSRLIFVLLLINLFFFVLMYISASSGQRHAEEVDPNRPHWLPGNPRLVQVDVNEFHAGGNGDQLEVIRRKIFPAENLRLSDNMDSDDAASSKSRDPFRRENPLFSSENLTCDDLKKPPENITVDFKWHSMDLNNRDAFMFSAYLDPRTRPLTLKVLGVSSGLTGRVYCQMWSAESDKPLVKQAVYTIIPETHDYRYAPAFFTCSLPHDARPYAVSVTSSKCARPTHHIRVLTPRDQTQNLTFTVCVSPLNMEYDDIYSFVEIIEMNRILGADKIVLYNHTVGARVGKYIRKYVSQGLIDLIPWDIPLPVHTKVPNPLISPEIHYFGQLGALNDCLYRYMFRSKYIILTDLDELLVPRGNESWYGMVKNITFSTASDRLFGAYVFRNTFFRIDWPDDVTSDHAMDTKFRLRTQLKLNREDRVWEWFMRTKVLVNPRMVDVTGIHFVIEFIRSMTTHCKVDPDVGSLHHYREWGDEDKEAIGKVYDPYMRRYRALLYEAVTRVHGSLGVLDDEI